MVEEDEIQNPSSRKWVGEDITYVSRRMLGGSGMLVLGGFGNACSVIDVDKKANTQVNYRAPETILKMHLGPETDMWSVALMVRLSLT
jgi:hypothetical protein